MLTLSSNTKKRLIKRLINHYGENFKTPLSKDLDVDVTTIRRIFNQREEIPIVYQKAIDKLLDE